MMLFTLGLLSTLIFLTLAIRAIIAPDPVVFVMLFVMAFLYLTNLRMQIEFFNTKKRIEFNNKILNRVGK